MHAVEYIQVLLRGQDHVVRIGHMIKGLVVAWGAVACLEPGQFLWV